MTVAIQALGAGIFLKVLLKSRFSLTAFVAALVFLQVEPFFMGHWGEGETVYSRTLGGALLLAAIMALSAGKFLAVVRRFGRKSLRPHQARRPPARKAAAPNPPLEPGRQKLADWLGALAGALASLALSALSGLAPLPLWPLSDWAPQAWPPEELMRLSLLFWSLSLVLWGLVNMRRPNK